MMSTLALLTVLPLAALAEGGDRPIFPPPAYVGPPRPDTAVTNRAFTGIPSVAIAPGGRLWATWYAGPTPGEDRHNYVVLSTSGDGGESWREVLVINPDGPGPIRAYDPELWLAPDGRLFCTWSHMDTSRQDVEYGLWAIETSQPDAAEPTWSAPRRLADGVMMCKPLVLADGAWAWPVSTWRHHDHSAQCVVSTDAGRTFGVRGGCNVPAADREFDEHMFIQRRDGSLWLLVRTKYGIGESVSTDGGRTWPELRPSTLAHPSARFYISRLASGHLLLVKHGPVAQRTGRSHLTAFLSRDDGATWLGGLLLDERGGVSYPDGQQAADGLIRLIYDYNRTTDRQILLASFREEDVAAGRDVSGAVRLRQVVSQGSGGQLPPVNDNRDGAALQRTGHGALSCPGVEPRPLVTGARLFGDRAYVAAELPAELAGARFLPIALDGAKTLTVAQAGVVWLLTPEPARNKDSVAQALVDQGFAKAALPEVRLFNPTATGNFCTLYQKACAAGETIQVGKWAVPLWLP